MTDTTEDSVRCGRCGQKAILKLTASPPSGPGWTKYLCEHHWYEELDRTHAEYLAAQQHGQ